MDEQLLALQAEIKASQEAREQAKANFGALQKKYTELETKSQAQDAELKSASENYQRAEAAVNDLGKKLDELTLKSSEQKNEFLPLGEAIAEVIESKSFRENHTSGRHKGASQEYELKASTATIVTPFANTQVDTSGIFRPTRPLAFLDTVIKGTFDKDKNNLVWLEGEYASNVGYVGEGTSNPTEDTVKVSEASRGVTKISAKLKITEEMREDASFVASELQTEMVGKALLWFDNEIYQGDGIDSDATKKKHIYGLKTHATPFSAAKAGVAAKFFNSTLTELADAIKLQGLMIDITDAKFKNDAGYHVDYIFLNPTDAAIYRHEKDTKGQYIIQRLGDGSQVMAGMRVIETKAVEANSLFAMDHSVVKLFLKRNPTLKFGQEQDDFSTDQYTYVMFIRAQMRVKQRDTKGLIYVSDITAALASLEKPAV